MTEFSVEAVFDATVSPDSLSNARATIEDDLGGIETQVDVQTGEIDELAVGDVEPVPVETPESMAVGQPDWVPLGIHRPEWLPLTVLEPNWLPIDPQVDVQTDDITIPEPEWPPLTVAQPDWLPIKSQVEVQTGDTERASRERALGRQQLSTSNDTLREIQTADAELVQLAQERNVTLSEILELLDDGPGGGGGDNDLPRRPRRPGGGGLGGVIGGGLLLGALVSQIDIPVPDLPELEVPEIPPVPVPNLPPLKAPDIPPLKAPDIPPLKAPDIPPLKAPDIPPITVKEPTWTPVNVPEPSWLPLDDPSSDTTGTPTPTPIDVSKRTKSPEALGVALTTGAAAAGLSGGKAGELTGDGEPEPGPPYMPGPSAAGAAATGAGAAAVSGELGGSMSPGPVPRGPAPSGTGFGFPAPSILFKDLLKGTFQEHADIGPMASAIGGPATAGFEAGQNLADDTSETQENEARRRREQSRNLDITVDQRIQVDPRKLERMIEDKAEQAAIDAIEKWAQRNANRAGR